MSNFVTANNIDQHFDDVNKSDNIDDSLLARVKRITSVSEVMRIFGACAVIASLSLFMLDGWSEGNDVNRYLKLLGQTGLLTLVGLILTFVVKEYKGARLFFGLGLISAVTNFTILGALIYSIIPLDGLLGSYPEAVTWTVGSSSQFALICAAAIILLATLAKFSYSIFARKLSGRLTLTFLGLNALLLIPIRGPLVISVLTVIALLVALQTVKQLSSDSDTVLTPETKFAFVTLFLPGLIIVGRALSLYHVDDLFVLTLCGLAYSAIRLLVANINTDADRSENKLTILTITQYCLGFVIAMLATGLLPAAMDNVAPACFSLIVLAFTGDQLRQGRAQAVRTAMLTISAIILVVINVLFALAGTLLATKLASFAMCVLIFLFANYSHSRVSSSNAARLIALLGAVITFSSMMFKLVAWMNISGWMTIGLVGIVSIVIGSCYERFGLKLRSYKRTMRSTELSNVDFPNSTSNSLET